MHLSIKNILLLGLGGLIFSCSDEQDWGGHKPPGSGDEGEAIGKAKVWVTNGSKTRLLSLAAEPSIVAGTETDKPFMSIDFGQKLQQIDGYGAALTGSSAYLINRMNATAKAALLRDLFDPQEGIGISYLRTTMGASDFSLSNYTYNDLPAGQTDPALSQFSIAKDKDDVVPALKSILAVAPAMKIMGSPWSAPAWMKTNASLAGGKLKPEWYEVYGKYFVKWVLAYAAEGIVIDAVTIQNEPLHEASYPSMRMEASEQAQFVKVGLGPAFAANKLQTKIIAYDHNFDRADYPIAVLNDAEARQYLAGSAFHAYAGNVSAMTQVHAAHPDKGLYFTEISGGGWATNFSDNLKWNMQNIFIGTANNWSKVALLWNLALNENAGPKNGGCQDCRGVVTIASNGQVTRNEEYYALGHMAKWVRPGAHRVQSTLFASASGLQGVAFINPDGSKVAVVLNTNANASTFSLLFGEAKLNYTLEGNAVATLLWQ